LQLRIDCLEDNAHAAGSQHAEDAVGSQPAQFAWLLGRRQEVVHLQFAIGRLRRFRLSIATLPGGVEGAEAWQEVCSVLGRLVAGRLHGVHEHVCGPQVMKPVHAEGALLDMPCKAFHVLGGEVAEQKTFQLLLAWTTRDLGHGELLSKPGTVSSAEYTRERGRT